MPLVALTGGIASGKSTIAARLAEHGAIVVDADQIVRDVQQPGSPVLADIAAEFGASMLAHRRLSRSGRARRARLRRPRRGGAAERDRAPRRARESARRFAAAFAADPGAVVVYDVPLLVEARASDPWELIVVAHAPAEVRRRRLVELRGMSEADAAARIASQVSDEARLAIADVVIDTTGLARRHAAPGRRPVGAAARAHRRARRALTPLIRTAARLAVYSDRSTAEVRHGHSLEVQAQERPYAALTDEERISRYVYLLNTLPASVIESAHAKAFEDLPPEQRREMFEQLRPFMSEDEREAASDDPTVLAKLVRRAEERRAQRARTGRMPTPAATSRDATSRRPARRDRPAEHAA